MQQDTLEKLKLFTEYLKHITTLSTASLILLTIFLEKLSRRPRWKTLVIVALCSFTLSLIASAIGFLGVLYLISGAGGKPELGDELWRVGGLLTIGGVIIGAICLSGFCIGHLHTANELPTPSATH